MVSPDSVKKQLKKLDFNYHGWGRTEVKELPNILLPDEEIYELSNGIYEGGFALLVATNIRVILVDKKPLNYLTVGDLRFDMINEIDYSHRLIGAFITVSTGNKTLHFTSYNQKRLRKLINHVQDCMAETKLKQSEHQEGQVSHLGKINEQLQAYLMAQQQYQQQLQEGLQRAQAGQQVSPPPSPAQPSPELSDYLYAQGLLNQYWASQASQVSPAPTSGAQPQQPPFQSGVQMPATQPVQSRPPTEDIQPADLYSEGVREIFSRRPHRSGFEINPLKVAYSKLPMALRNRRFGRPSFHAHSQSN